MTQTELTQLAHSIGLSYDGIQDMPHPVHAFTCHHDGPAKGCTFYVDVDGCTPQKISDRWHVKHAEYVLGDYIRLKSVDTIGMVREFHDAFGVPTPDKVSIHNEERNALRLRLILEEGVVELGKALAYLDSTGVLDALTDLRYVLDGALLEFGLADVAYEAFAEVHRSNMSKLDANGKPIFRDDGKILKGPNYQPPNLERFIK